MPATQFPYRINTTSIHEHSRGVAWIAELILNEKVVGLVEQAGVGGADEVSFYSIIAKEEWEFQVNLFFSGNE